MSICKKLWDGIGIIICLFNLLDKEEIVCWIINVFSFEVLLVEEKIVELKENIICIFKKGFVIILLEGE